MALTNDPASSAAKPKISDVVKHARIEIRKARESHALPEINSALEIAEKTLVGLEKTIRGMHQHHEKQMYDMQKAHTSQKQEIALRDEEIRVMKAPLNEEMDKIRGAHKEEIKKLEDGKNEATNAFKLVLEKYMAMLEEKQAPENKSDDSSHGAVPVNKSSSIHLERKAIMSAVSHEKVSTKEPCRFLQESFCKTGDGCNSIHVITTIMVGPSTIASPVNNDSPRKPNQKSTILASPHSPPTTPNVQNVSPQWGSKRRAEFDDYPATTRNRNPKWSNFASSSESHQPC